MKLGTTEATIEGRLPKGTEENREKSQNIGGVPIDIRTGHLPIAQHKHYQTDELSGYHALLLSWRKGYVIVAFTFVKPRLTFGWRYVRFLWRVFGYVFCTLIIHSFISIQPWRPGLARTRAQSCDRYGSGTLHPGQVLGGSLHLLSPAFRRSHFSRQLPPSATTREILAAKGGTVGEKDVL